MNPASTFGHIAWSTALVLALVSACAQKNSGATGVGREGGSDAGGARENAGLAGGRPPGGGSAADGGGGESGGAGGGPGGGGGATDGGGAGGDAGATSRVTPADPKCSLAPPESHCNTPLIHWYYSGVCRPLPIGGCDRYANDFATLEACQQACGAPPSVFDACESPSDCGLTGVACCGLPAGTDLQVTDLLAYNAQHAAEVTQCERSECPSYTPPEPGQGSLEFFAPDCVQGKCVVIDLRP